MAVAGLRGTGDWGTGERPKNFRESILWRDPNGSAPLTALMAKMKKEVTDDPEFSWWEEELNVVRLQIAGALTTGDTTFVIDSGDAQDLVAGDVMLVEKAAESATYDNELIVVSSVTNTTTFVVTRGQANTTPGTIADDTFLTRIGNVFAEGTGSPDSSTRNPTKYLNFTQIFKTSYRITGTAENTHARTGDPVKNDKKRKMFDHSANMEFAFVFGRPYETTGSNGKPKRFTGGLMHYLSEAYSAGYTHCRRIFTTTPTEDDILNAVYKVWDYNSNGAGNERIVLAGNEALNTLNKIARDSSSTRINFEGTVKVYGMELQKWVTPQGTLYIKTHPLFNTHGYYTRGMLVINPAGMVYRPMKGRDTRMQDNIQANDADERKGQYFGECGVEFQHLNTMAYLGNVYKA